jgi:hypothetical protein
MNLFKNKKIKEIYFSKEEVLRNIKKFSSEIVLWRIIDKFNILNHPIEDENIPDIFFVKSININKEISITENPFSHYRRIVPSTYQIIVGVYITQDLEKTEVSTGFWRSINVDSAELLFRKLDQEE